MTIQGRDSQATINAVEKRSNDHWNLDK